jgi:hypothetical protein
VTGATLLVTSVILFGAISGNRSGAAHAQPDSAKPCAPAEVGSLVVRFIDSLNAGNVAHLDRSFARKPHFRWYSTDAPGQRFLPIASDRASLMRYFARRHAHGEHLRLRSLRVNGNTVAAGLEPYGNFEYRLVRSAHISLRPTTKARARCIATAPRPDAIIV